METNVIKPLLPKKIELKEIDIYIIIKQLFGVVIDYIANIIKIKFIVKYVMVVLYVLMTREKIFVINVMEVKYVFIKKKNLSVQNAKVVIYAFIISKKHIVKSVQELAFVVIIKGKIHALYVVINPHIFVLIVILQQVKKDIYLQKIHMKSYVLIVTIIYIQMKKKFLQNIRKNNILFTKNFKKDMVKIISNMT